MLKVEKLIPGGYGLATLEDGKKIFLLNALPGELVEDYRVTKSKSHFLEAVATKITEASPHRKDPKDTCYLSTSPWQIMDYTYELATKQALVVELFREHHISVPTPEIFSDSRDYYYRNKMEYALYYDHADSLIHLAFHDRGSHHKTPIDKSSIERPELFSAASAIVDDLNSRHEEARKYQSLLLRCNQQGEVSGGPFENGKPHPSFPKLQDTILGHTYSYSPNGFFQINLPVYEMALREISKYITTDDVLDLYSGVGTIGLSVARDKKLTLVECDRSAYNELLNNTKSIPNATPLLAKSEDIFFKLTSSQTVILDPPRAGLDRRLVEHLLSVTPTAIIYLSCNPATQARDVAALLEKYQITSASTYNFFPHTPHIENLIVLSRRP